MTIFPPPELQPTKRLVMAKAKMKEKPFIERSDARIEAKSIGSSFSNSGAMGHSSWGILPSILDCEGEAIGGRRAAQAETWKIAIGRSLRKRGREAGKQKGARSTVCA
jgi:hypothetical protein